MFTTILLLAAATTPAPTGGMAAPAPAPSATPAVERRYCVVTTPTASHIQRRDCRTRAQWLKDGFDPTAVDQR